MAEKHKLSIISMSGDFDKVIAVFTLASGAAAPEKLEVKERAEWSSSSLPFFWLSDRFRKHDRMLTEKNYKKGESKRSPPEIICRKSLITIPVTNERSPIHV